MKCFLRYEPCPQSLKSVELVREARRKEAEDAFAEAIEKARLAKMSDDEIREIVELILTEG